ncbi:MAG: ABC transporter permease subunit [Ornithinimicrobium sp.]
MTALSPWSVVAVSVRDRVVGVLIGAVSIGLLLWFTLAVYADLDLSFYYELPPALLDSVGISAEAGGIAGIAYGSMYNLMGAMTLGGLAIAIGAGLLAGEEQSGTLSLLLGNPRSRTRVVSAKITALVILVGLGASLMYAAGRIAPLLTGTDISGLHVAALMVHLGFASLFWGMLALALGAWTGQPTTSAGAAAAFMVASWLATSILPMLDAGRAWARLFPWYYFSSSAPEVNGVYPAHLAVLGTLVLAAAGLAVVGVNRRDLRAGAGRRNLLDRLRAHPRTAAMADRLGGRARVSSIGVKTVSEHQGLTVVISLVTAYLAVLMPLFYTFLPEGTSEFFAQLPDSLIAMIGGVDMSTAAGYLQGEVFAIAAPIALIVLTATIGADALAGEEHARTMGLLLVNAVSRRRVVLHKAAAMALLAAVVGLITFAGSVLGVWISGVDVAVSGLASTCTMLTLLGVAFGSLALAVGAGTGRSRWATGATAGAAVTAYVVQSFLPLSPRYADAAAISPFHYYLGSDPLTQGMPWADAGVLLILSLVLVSLAVLLFDRRDLRG